MRALETLADVFAANFKYREAFASYMTVWQNAGYSDELACKIGVALSLDGKYKEAKDFFEAVAVKYPNNGELLYRLTEVYCELGDIKQANALLMLNRFGNSKENLVWHKASQGRIHEAQNNADLALNAYLAAHMVNDNNAHVNLALGRLFFKQADFHSAIPFLNAANAIDPVNMQPLVLKAKTHQELGNYSDAISIYEQILTRNPKLSEISLSAASIKEGQGDVNGAIKTLNNGLTFNPKDANLLFQLGRLYQTTKQYELAINAYQSSIGGKASGHNVESLRMIGEIYYTKLTNEKKAVEYFKKYVKAGGKDNNVAYLIKKINSKG
jgi:tetratricopeptide (TPR) repeat protein